MGTETTSKSRLWVWIMIPVGLGLGVLFGTNLFRSPPPTPQELFEQYYIPHHLPVLFPEGGGVTNWTEAARSYQVGNYAKAEAALRKAEEEDEMPLSVTSFYIGQCLLATDKPGDALVIFREAIQIQESPHEAIRWYMALAHLKLGEVAPAKDLLWEIENDKGYKSGTAIQLLEDFDR